MSHATQLHNPSYFDDYMEMIHRRGLPGNVKTEVRQHVHHAVLTTVQSVIERNYSAGHLWYQRSS